MLKSCKDALGLTAKSCIARLIISTKVQKGTSNKIHATCLLSLLQIENLTHGQDALRPNNKTLKKSKSVLGKELKDEQAKKKKVGGGKWQEKQEKQEKD